MDPGSWTLDPLVLDPRKHVKHAPAEGKDELTISSKQNILYALLPCSEQRPTFFIHVQIDFETHGQPHENKLGHAFQKHSMKPWILDLGSRALAPWILDPRS